MTDEEKEAAFEKLLIPIKKISILSRMIKSSKITIAVTAVFGYILICWIIVIW